jgi:hypothetical protein
MTGSGEEMDEETKMLIGLKSTGNYGFYHQNIHWFYRKPWFPLYSLDWFKGKSTPETMVFTIK